MVKKYIVELESGTHIFVLGPEGIIHIGEPDVVYKTIDGMQIGDTIINAEPYTEPDLEQVRKEAYEHGYKKCLSEHDFDSPCVSCDEYKRGLADAKCGYENGFENGMIVAWDAARKIGSNSMCGLKEIGFDFSQCDIADYNPSWFVIKNYSASEAIEKIRQYEQEQEEQIQVGDEVINRDKKAVVTEITDRFVRIMYSDGSGYALFSENMTKTGRHFPEIATVLEKMRGEQDG